MVLGMVQELGGELTDAVDASWFKHFGRHGVTPQPLVSPFKYYKFRLLEHVLEFFLLVLVYSFAIYSDPVSSRAITFRALR